MTERVDHIVQARILQKEAQGIISDSPTVFAPHMAAVILLDEARLEVDLAAVEQQRITNRLKVAELDLKQRAAEMAWGGQPLDFHIRPYLTADDWESLEVEEPE